jgi:hypothetical protein
MGARHTGRQRSRWRDHTEGAKPDEEDAMSGIPYGAYVLLWMVAIVSIPVAFVVALTQVWRHREKRDGKR